jgi:hypothetical protein
MKNRYGMDGITYQMNADTSNGHFKITGEFDEDSAPTPSSAGSPSSLNLDAFDKKHLSKEFFKVNY